MYKNHLKLLQGAFWLTKRRASHHHGFTDSTQDFIRPLSLYIFTNEAYFTTCPKACSRE